MFNVQERKTYEVWVDGVLLATTKLLHIRGSVLHFADFPIEITNIDALRRVR